MLYHIKFRSSAIGELKSLQPKLQQRVRDAIDALAAEPRPLGFKKLKGFANFFRIRVSDIRIVYSIEDEVLIIKVITIGARGDIYKKLKKNL